MRNDDGRRFHTQWSNRDVRPGSASAALQYALDATTSAQAKVQHGGDAAPHLARAARCIRLALYRIAEAEIRNQGVDGLHPRDAREETPKVRSP